MTFRIRRWRNINLFPTLSAVTIVTDERPYRPIQRMFEFVWFGQIIEVMVATKKSRRAWSFGRRGPTWHRRKKA